MLKYIAESLSKKTIRAMAFKKVTSDFFKFKRALTSVEATQRNILSILLDLSHKTEYGEQLSLTKEMPWEDFNRNVPVLTRDSLSGLIDRQIHEGTPVLSSEKCIYYSPDVAGSDKPVLIPYTESALAETERANSLIMVYMYQKNSAPFSGKYFKQIPWYPPSLRHGTIFEINAGDNRKSWYQKKVNQHLQAVPESTAFTEDYDSYCFAASAYLASCQDLTLLTLENPLSALNLFDYLYNHRFELANTFRTGSWGPRQSSLSQMPFPTPTGIDVLALSEEFRTKKDLLNSLWPGLRLISSWNSNSSKQWNRELMALFPRALLCGTGLRTAAGVVTVPYEEKFPLAVTSHFYEFRDLDTGAIHPAWELKMGQVLQPVISTGSGLLRYELDEVVAVTGFIKECPCFEHRCKTGIANIAGEKMTHLLAQKALDEITRRLNMRAVSLIAVNTGSTTADRPFYLALCEGSALTYSRHRITQQIEEILKHHFHYKLARDLNRLAPLQIITSYNVRQLYRQIAVPDSSTPCDYIIEPLILWGPEDYNKHRGLLKQ